jgi:hypothetical protein
MNGSKLVRLLGSGGVALTLAAAGYVGIASSASAAVGSYYWDNKAPAGTSCANDAYTAASTTIGGATLLLRYSPSCRTVWAHIENAATYIPGQQDGGQARILREQDGAALYCHAPSGGRSCITNMLYDGGFTSHATGWNDTGFQIYTGHTSSY